MSDVAERLFKKLAASRAERELLNEEARALPQNCFMPPLEKRKLRWYGNLKAMMLYKKQLGEFYQSASEIDVEELLNATPGQRYKYQLLMDDWRRISSILDTPDVHNSEVRQEEALDALARKSHH
jgi:hypothetical protein